MTIERGKLIIISGFSGVGKGTVIAKLMEEHKGFAFSVSGTTRYQRPGEIDGVHYFFLSREEFEQGIREGKFLEHAEYNGNYYGTFADYVDKRRDEGIHIILDIEVQGAMQVMRRCPDALSMFLIPPDAATLVHRLTGRGTETREQIRGRLEQAVRESAEAEKYRAILVNDQIQNTVDEIYGMVQDPSGMEAYRRENLPRVAVIRDDLEKILNLGEY